MILLSAIKNFVSFSYTTVLIKMVKHSPHYSKIQRIEQNDDRLYLKDTGPAQIFDFNKIYSNLTTKMSSFFVVVTIVVLIWLIIKWLLKMLASLAWLVTLVFVTMVSLDAGGIIIFQRYFIETFASDNHRMFVSFSHSCSTFYRHCVMEI